MRKMTQVGAFALAGLMALSLTACGGESEQEVAGESNTKVGSSQAAENDSKSVKVWLTAGAEDDVYREIFRELEASEGITIQDEYYSKEELDSKMQVSGIAGDMPDLIVADYLILPNYVDAQMIAPIDEYITEDIKNDILPSVIDEATYNGQMYAVAQFDGGLAMWGNKKMLEDAGVTDIPTSYKDAWTKEEFEDVLAKLKENGVEYPWYVRQNNPSTMYYTYFPVIHSFGGDYANRDTMLTEGTLNGSGTKASMEYLTELIEKGYINPTCDYDDAFQTKQESAIALMGHWNYRTYAEGIGEENMVCIPIPDFGNGVFTCSGSTVWSMTTGAVDNGNADIAWSVMEYMMKPESIEKVVSVNSAIPSRISVLDKLPDYQEGGKFYLYREQLEGGISYLRPFTSAHMTIFDQMKSVYSDIFAGANASDSLDAAAAAIDEIIIENGWNIEN